MNESAPAPRPPLQEFLAPFRLPGIAVLAAFGAFLLARLATLLLHRGDFAELSGVEIGGAFVRGLRFDAAAIFPILGVPLLFFMMPVRGPWTRVWAWICFAILALLLLVLAMDVVYFGFVHRHAGLEATEPVDAAKHVGTSAALQYLIPVILYLALVAGLALGWRRLLRPDPPLAPRPGVQVAMALGFAVLMYFGERGTLSGKRLRVVHAFQDAPASAAHLSLNGPYCIVHSLVHSKAVRTAWMPAPEALKTAQESLFTPGERVPDPGYPLLRARSATAASKPNVVVIMLESWDAAVTDVHRRELGLPPLGCTPCYDALSAEGRLFARFLACGQRSMDGLSAMLCGVPTLPGMPYLGRGLEQSSLSGLGRLAAAEGYDSWFITSAERDSFRVDAIAAMTGFAHYLGAEDIPPAPPAEPRAELRGCCWDHEMFAEAAKRFSGAKRPFLGFLYTSTTHHPYFWPGERWNKFREPGPESRYRNSIAYGDWALGQFFDAAKAAGWFQDTVFIVTADHISGTGLAGRPDLPATLHHTPGLVLAPGLKPGVEKRTASQLDVIPTVAELAGWTAPQAALGTSLVSDPAPGRSALCVQGTLVLRVEDGGWVLHSLEGRVRAEGDADAIERRLLSVTQAAYALLRSNRLAKRP